MENMHLTASQNTVEWKGLLTHIEHNCKKGTCWLVNSTGSICPTVPRDACLVFSQVLSSWNEQGLTENWNDCVSSLLSLRSRKKLWSSSILGRHQSLEEHLQRWRIRGLPWLSLGKFLRSISVRKRALRGGRSPCEAGCRAQEAPR